MSCCIRVNHPIAPYFMAAPSAGSSPDQQEILQRLRGQQVFGQLWGHTVAHGPQSCLQAQCMPVVNPQSPPSSEGVFLSSSSASHGSNTTNSGMHADARTNISASLQTSCLSASVALVSSKSSHTEHTAGSAGMLMWSLSAQKTPVSLPDGVLQDLLLWSCPGGLRT